MDIYVLDTNFNSIGLVDTYESFIWTERYSSYGDFELYMPMQINVLTMLIPGNYLSINQSKKYMLVEDFSIGTDVEQGNYLTVTGRSLESILERRVFSEHTALSGYSLQNTIRKMLEMTCIYPTDTARKMKLFFKENPNLQADDFFEPSVEYFGDNLYDAIVDLLANYGVGFRIFPLENGQMDFELYEGVDRSGDNDIPMVAFSPNYDNFLNSNYNQITTKYKTDAYVAGSGEEPSARYIAHAGTYATGLDRREMFVDASNISQLVRDEEGTETELTDDEYEAILIQEGNRAIYETSEGSEAFEGEVEPSRQFVLNKDFFLGDIVYVENEYGMSMRCRISEIVISDDLDGYKIIPTFTSEELDEEI